MRIVDSDQVVLYVALLNEAANQRSMSAVEVTVDYYVSQAEDTVRAAVGRLRTTKTRVTDSTLCGGEQARLYL
jgi:hypothetical protein